MSNIRQKLNEAVGIEDILTFGGIAMIGYGLWQVRPWLAYTVCGTLLMLLGTGWLARIVKK